MTIITNEMLEKLRAEHPEMDLRVLRHPGMELEVVARVPSKGDWRRFKTMGADPSQRPLANETLVLNCIVSPPAAEMAAMLDRFPGLADTFSGEIGEIAGVTGAATNRK